MENSLALNHKLDELIESLKSLLKEIDEEDLAEHEYREQQDLVPSVDELEPQLLPNFPSLDVNLGDKRGTDSPINPYSPRSFRMNILATVFDASQKCPTKCVCGGCIVPLLCVVTAFRDSCQTSLGVYRTVTHIDYGFISVKYLAARRCQMASQTTSHSSGLCLDLLRTVSGSYVIRIMTASGILVTTSGLNVNFGCSLEWLSNFLDDV
ncbi:hypothetical protein Tco_1450094 [Tanacetum coccineum]